MVQRLGYYSDFQFARNCRLMVAHDLDWFVDGARMNSHLHGGGQAGSVAVRARRRGSAKASQRRGERLSRRAWCRGGRLSGYNNWPSVAALRQELRRGGCCSDPGRCLLCP